eukprot:Tamp_17582.p5 GENE.Tamp_17582~~Tamp_17582.p5  ORF type:complete len:125 (+),score=12.32 Tamp_17582:521-895(+)
MCRVLMSMRMRELVSMHDDMWAIRLVSVEPNVLPARCAPSPSVNVFAPYVRVDTAPPGLRTRARTHTCACESSSQRLARHLCMLLPHTAHSHTHVHGGACVQHCRNQGNRSATCPTPSRDYLDD